MARIEGLFEGHVKGRLRAMNKEGIRQVKPKRRRGRPETRILNIKGTPEQVARAIFAAAKPPRRLIKSR